MKTELTAIEWFNRVKDEQIRETLLKAYKKSRMDKEGNKYDSLSIAIHRGIDWSLSDNFYLMDDLHNKAEAGKIELIEESPKPFEPVPGEYYEFSNNEAAWSISLFYVGKRDNGKYVSDDGHSLHSYIYCRPPQKTKITLKELIEKAGLNPETTEVDLNS